MAPSSIHIPVLKLGAGPLDDAALRTLTDACQEHGFMFLENAKPESGFHVPPMTMERIKDVAKEIFDCTAEEKERVNVKASHANRGYFSSVGYAEYNQDPNGVSIHDNKEGFFFGSDSFIAPGNVAPKGKEALIPEVDSYMSLCASVCRVVMRAIAATGLMGNLDADERDPDAFVSKYLSDPVFMLKLLKYPPQNGNTDAHTDYGCITLLLPGDSGLQINVRGEWHDVPVIPNAFVINFGDLLSMWSGGAIKSTIHRVVYRSSDPTRFRYSVPFFLHPSVGSKIQCGDGAVVDSYSYVLSRFDATYAHRKKAAEAAAAAVQGGVDAK